MIKTLCLIIIIPLLFFSCQERVSIEGFNEALWKQDLLACEGVRKDYIPILSQEKELLMGLSESRILELLGKPDFQELYGRNQKFYYYFIEAGPQCESGKLGTNEGTFQIRFNALGYANEIIINN